MILYFYTIKRYNIGRCNKKSWSKLNDNYQKLLVKSKVVISAMSRYDEEYQVHFTGIRPYAKLYAHGTFYAKNIPYNPIKSEILVGPTNGLGRNGKEWIEEIKHLGASKNLEFKTVREVYPHYELSNLAEHPAIIIFPYAVMSYSIVDFYAANLSIFVPSIDIMTTHRSCRDRTVGKLCDDQFEPIEAPKTSQHGNFNPNSDDEADYRYWLQFADYYQWPFVTVFESWSHLFELLQTLDLRRISESMRAFNRVRQAYALDDWCRIIKSLPSEQPIPDSYEEALRYFNMSSVQMYS
jgi:hypothetical protein